MEFDPYCHWLQIPADRRPPDFYDLLGLPRFEADAERIRTASMRRSADVRRFCLGPQGADANRLLGELGAAFACLADPVRKAAYDESLGGRAAKAVSVSSGMSDNADAPPVQLSMSAEQQRSSNAEAAAHSAVNAADHAVTASRTTTRLRRNLARRARKRTVARGTALMLALPIVLAALVVAVQFRKRSTRPSNAEAKPTVEAPPESRPAVEVPLENDMPVPSPADASNAAAPPAGNLAETGLLGEAAPESPVASAPSQPAAPGVEIAAPALPLAPQDTTPAGAGLPPMPENKPAQAVAAAQPMPPVHASPAPAGVDAAAKPAAPAQNARPAEVDGEKNNEQAAVLAEVQYWLDRADEDLQGGTVHGARMGAFHLGEAIRAAGFEINDKTDEAARRLAECLKLIRDDRTGAGPVARQVTKEADATLNKFRRLQQRAAARAVTEN